LRIVLDENFILESDEVQFLLFRRQEAKEKVVVDDSTTDVKEPNYIVVAYGGSLDDILKSYFRRRLMRSNATTLAELVQEIKALHEHVAKLAKGEIE